MIKCLRHVYLAVPVQDILDFNAERARSRQQEADDPLTRVVRDFQIKHAISENKTLKRVDRRASRLCI